MSQVFKNILNFSKEKYSNFKIFWFVQIIFQLLKKLTETNCKENGKTVYTANFSTFYISTPDNLPIKIPCF